MFDGRDTSDILYGLQERSASDMFFYDEVGEGFDLLKEIDGDPIFDVYDDSDHVHHDVVDEDPTADMVDEENNVNFIGIQDMDVIKFTPTDHVQEISKFDMMGNNTYLVTRSYGRGYDEIVFANHGRGVISELRDRGCAKKILLQDEIHISLYVDPRSAIYSDFELPYCVRHGYCCFQVLCQGGTSEDVYDSYMTNQKDTYTRICNLPMEFKTCVVGQDDLLYSRCLHTVLKSIFEFMSLSFSSRSKVSNGHISLVNPIQWYLVMDLFDTNKKYMVDLSVASSTILWLFSHEHMWHSSTTCKSMHVFSSMSKAVAQMTCEGRNTCQPSFVPSNTYFRVRRLLCSQCEVRLLIHEDIPYTLPSLEMRDMVHERRDTVDIYRYYTKSGVFLFQLSLLKSFPWAAHLICGIEEVVDVSTSRLSEDFLSKGDNIHHRDLVPRVIFLVVNHQHRMCLQVHMELFLQEKLISPSCVHVSCSLWSMHALLLGPFGMRLIMGSLYDMCIADFSLCGFFKNHHHLQLGTGFTNSYIFQHPYRL